MILIGPARPAGRSLATATGCQNMRIYRPASVPGPVLKRSWYVICACPSAPPLEILASPWAPASDAATLFLPVLVLSAPSISASVSVGAGGWAAGTGGIDPAPLRTPGGSLDGASR